MVRVVALAVARALRRLLALRLHEHPFLGERESAHGVARGGLDLALLNELLQELVDASLVGHVRVGGHRGGRGVLLAAVLHAGLAQPRTRNDILRGEVVRLGAAFLAEAALANTAQVKVGKVEVKTEV